MRSQEFMPRVLRTALRRLALSDLENLTRDRVRITLTGVVSGEELAALQRAWVNARR